MGFPPPSGRTGQGLVLDAGEIRGGDVLAQPALFPLKTFPDTRDQFRAGTRAPRASAEIRREHQRLFDGNVSSQIPTGEPFLGSRLNQGREGQHQEQHLTRDIP